ncbi:DeoR/GlpR family DNA-binding transcription regulator [Jiangella asiatica]|uniref:DeoR/GlpR transcriptional regulator n=1 Tax=Jiangella asiatica TaxID=2530372 RepID=A0A4R5DQD7_9ACTN|nr:DeoR/GlpR family DNA-binding transcription regulator [Jiangella asiatica]TDE15867.1 DeoR/GlpR transcriptional regulator [Jiangella asiatica]
MTTRHELIRRELLANGFVATSELSERFGVDVSTIRRDLAVLEREGALRRSHGGATALTVAGEPDIPYRLKKTKRLPQKKAIAEHAAGLVSDGQILVIDSGSTTYAFVERLRHLNSLTIVTNDLRVAKFSAEQAGWMLLVTGGQVMEGVYTMIGDHAVRLLGEVRADWAFLGADAIDPTAGITNSSLEESKAKRAMIVSASATAVLADSSKFGHRSVCPVAAIDDVRHLITDDDLPVADRGAYGDRLICVAADPAAESS